MSYAVPYAGGRHRAHRAPVTVAAAPAAAAAAGSPKRRLMGVVTNVVLLMGVLLFVGLAIGPHVFGYRTATMLTGSMSPEINPGDVVVTVPKPASELEVGDVVTYQIPIEDHRVETHRVTEVSRTEGGAVEFHTKGDANEGVDPWTAVVHDTDTVWQTKQVVPHLGTAIRAMRNPLIQRGLFWFAFAGVLALGLSMIWRPAGQAAGAVSSSQPSARPASSSRTARIARPALPARLARSSAGSSVRLKTYSEGRTMTKQEQAVAGAVFMVLVAVTFLVSISYAVLALT